MNIALIGTICACPSPKNAFQYEVRWNVKGDVKKTLPNIVLSIFKKNERWNNVSCVSWNLESSALYVKKAINVNGS